MNTELTAEKVMELGKVWGETYLSLLAPEERLEGLDAKDIISTIDHQKILSELPLEEIEAYLKQQKKQ